MLRRPLSGLTELRPGRGFVALACTAIGITAFDGASEGPLWSGLGSAIERAASDLGLGPATAAGIASTVGLVLFVGLVAGIYGLGVRGIRTAAPERSATDLGRAFAHSLVPIALAYVVAHYFSMLAFQGQAAIELASDPLGSGHDLFGTAHSAVDYTFLSAGVIWYVQVAALTAGHALGLTLAHDRALSSFRHARVAVRSQHWMLTVMVGFTSLGLLLLSASNA